VCLAIIDTGASALNLEVLVKLLNTVVIAVCYVDIVIIIDSDTSGIVELPLFWNMTSAA